MNNCVFCRIVAGYAQAHILYQDDDVTAFRDLRPQAPVHVLIVPNRHVAGVDSIEPEDAVLLGKLFLVARRLAEQEGIVNGYRLGSTTALRQANLCFICTFICWVAAY